jgi:uncharacterized repeat protein (TIGR01451 family)
MTPLGQRAAGGPQGAFPAALAAPSGFVPPPACPVGPPLAAAPEGAAGILPVAPMGIPLPQGIVTPWKPPGIAGPWPADEYLWDGGEHYPIQVNANLEVQGMDLEDTIVHYDTVDGQTIVEPSNRVAIYAPRFGAVRKVTAALQSHKGETLVAVDQPVRPVLHEEEQIATTALQPVQPVGEIGTKPIGIERLNLGEGRIANVLRPAVAADKLMPFEDFEVVRSGMIEQSEKARLAESVLAAIVWSHDTAVQAVLEGQMAVVEIGDQRAQATFVVDVPNHPRLRVIKLASTAMARPGDTVDFTIRFDNIGDQAIGNVTLLDNLTTRLEYVEGSQQSSRTAEFSTQPNEGDSSLVRWEFNEPLNAGDGGVVRFQCRVR